MYNYIANGCYDFCIFIFLKIENEKVITRGRTFTKRHVGAML